MTPDKTIVILEKINQRVALRYLRVARWFSPSPDPIEQITQYDFLLLHGGQCTGPVHLKVVDSLPH